MIRSIIRKLALKYTDLETPIDTENVTIAGLDAYIKLHRLVTGLDYHKIQYIKTSKSFREGYKKLLIPTKEVVSVGRGFQSIRYKNIRLLERARTT